MYGFKVYIIRKSITGFSKLQLAVWMNHSNMTAAQLVVLNKERFIIAHSVERNQFWKGICKSKIKTNVASGLTTSFKRFITKTNFEKWDFLVNKKRGLLHYA